MSLYQNKYRIESARWQNWDYSSAGAYFITICTKSRVQFLGRCKEGEMVLSEAGLLVDRFWKEIPEHSPHVRLGAHVVMPNHVHGIIILGDAVETLHCNVLTEKPRPLYNSSLMSSISPKAGSLSAIIRSYKIVCKKRIRSLKVLDGKETLHGNTSTFEWQDLFHDRVIRNQQEYERIENYIINNPSNWESDKFYGN